MPPQPVFDGHNDLLTVLYSDGGVAAADSVAGRDGGHLDLPRAHAGGFAGGFFAVWIPVSGTYDDYMEQMNKESYDLPLPDPVPQSEALTVALAQVATLNRLEALGFVKICRTVDEIEQAVASGVVAAILHFEGAEAIDPEFHVLDVMWRAGLRSLGPVWSRTTIYGEGVPFRFPTSPDIGGGLTDDGRRLVAKCNELGIMIDLSHLNEAGFWDVAEVSDAPLVATHSNAHALSPHSRNLTDAQLGAIAASDGLVGLNFATALLREDGQMRPDVPLAGMLAHLDHLLGLLGEDRVALGSDFDGAVVPEEIADVAGLPKLVHAMRDHGYTDALVEKICFGNWMGVLSRTWK